MNVKTKLLEKLSEIDSEKLSLICFHFKKPVVSSNRVSYNKNLAKSSFYNTNDMATDNFKKLSSLMISSEFYGKI